MPSSPGPNDYQRTPQRFFYRGVSLLPQDALPDGKVAFARNMRSYQDGTVGPRYGVDQLTASAVAGPIRSIFRLNDTTPYADAGAPNRRFLMADGQLYGGTPGVDTYAVADAGPYSDNPVTGIVCAPLSSPRPWLYVADSERMRKINSDLADLPWGLPQPNDPPTATLAAPEVTYLNTVGSAGWVGYGADVPGGAVSTINRVTAVVTNLLYDSGSTGMACVALDDMSGLSPGATVDIGAAPETVIVHEIFPAVGSTTIAAIIYDSGNTGLCTIQPTGSFAAGQIEAGIPAELRRRYNDLDQPVGAPVTITRTIDYPVNALILLGGVEAVRIQSIAIGPDGALSFRCSTAGTFAAGNAIAGIASFRAYFNTTKNVGDPAAALALTVVLTPASSAATFGGVQSAMTGGTRNWNLVGAVATQPDDMIVFGIRLATFANVDAVRIMLNVSDDDGFGGSDFLHNYYLYEWRASDLRSAIMSAAEVPSDLLVDTQKTAVNRGQVESIYREQYGQYGTDAPLFDGTDLIPRVPTDDNKNNVDEVEISPNIGPSAVAAKGALADGGVTVGSTQTRQLAVGDSQWMTLRCRVGDLTRVGTDQTCTLGTILGAAIAVRVEGTTDPIQIDISDCYLQGGYGPDAAVVLPGYVYRYRYRDNITGAKSNPSPPTRAGITPHRGRVQLTASECGVASNIVVDWFRFGGALARWTYVGTCDNGDPATFNDDYADRQINGGETLRFDSYQPWPTYDLPRQGTATLAGTALQWVSGDTFDVDWAANSAIIINGRATALYQSPASTTLLHVIDNCGSGTVDFFLPSPTFLAQPLPCVWGGPIGNAWFTFACGDPTDPGALHWSNANDPDTTIDRNYLVVSSASEPLQNGFMLNGQPFVFSTERLYAITPTPGGLSMFQTQETGCTIGLWSRWALAVADEGCYFLAKDGIYLTNGGAAAPITGEDFRPLFPQDGTESEAIRNLYPIDFTAVANLVLTVVGRLLYFDYLDTTGAGRTLVYDRFDKAWTPDAYLESADATPVSVPITARYSEPGPQVIDHLLGGNDGHLYEYTIEKITDVLLSINWALWPIWYNGGDPRAFKQWGDAVLDFNPGGSVAGISVTPVVDNGNVALTENIVGQTGTVRDTYQIEVGTGGGLGYGVLSRNFGLLIEGSVQACDEQRPLFYLWEPSWIPKGISVITRATDWDDLGYKGAKFVQGVVIRANTYGETKSVQVQYDGPNAAPTTALTLALTHDGERALAYPLAAAGWTPFIGELVRLQGADDQIPWTLLDWRWIWEPAPELATQWETQFTTHDYPGFLTVHDGIVAYQSTTDISWVIDYQDGSTATYTLASSAGLYRRIRQICEAQKGKAVRYRWTADAPFRLFKRDCAVRVQGWGFPGGYQIVSPFGGPSRVDGAEI